ncbi:ion channel [Oceanobacillus picturae]|jgi:potassium channel LctB|uniref:Ion channel n=1 Tax=Oceanobacillus picturae TaxID=171693 RepID=W9AFH6_9BACI|nr:potassium channel family protein [Oceanobacillus picturae]GAQ17182.1 ion channel [Oceanobacillus picturae]CDO04474.1 Ion channel [Oceanobacillus picturae]
METIPFVLLAGICAIMLQGIIDFIRGKKLQRGMRESRFSTELFYGLIIIYLMVMVGFGLIYFMLSFEEIILVESGVPREVGPTGSFIHSMYFSGVTLLTIGYGDITPVGVGRFIAVIEALIGYILPAAFVLRLVQYGQRSRGE